MVAGGLVAFAGPTGAAAAATCTRENYQDLNGGGADLVVGVPGATASGVGSAGAVDIHYNGSATVAQRLTRSSFTGLPAPSGQTRFGAATSVLDAGDGCAALVVGAPGVDAGKGEVVIAKTTACRTRPTMRGASLHPRRPARLQRPQRVVESEHHRRHPPHRPGCG